MGMLTDLPVRLKDEYVEDPVARALLRILEQCDRHQGGSTVPLNAFLLSLYDGETWAPDMQLLCRRIDADMFRDVVTAMAGYASTGRETHVYFVDGDRMFEGIARQVRTRLAGRYCDE
ncbi:DUF7673 family protein [Nitrogeniibacter aestuarii]|uniref:DUF7673 family protein n=1 Tax=Nitrogeniibacter aestuarii TaxID=2815343 RepID=UPI001E3AA099|nr:hypothetical protein [Nitrogeniibacter aestuarii]